MKFLAAPVVKKKNCESSFHPVYRVAHAKAKIKMHFSNKISHKTTLNHLS